MESPRLDLRALPVWERPAKVFDVFDTLPPGETLAFITENEPRGLSGRIELGRRHQLIVDARRTGEREWIVYLTRANNEVDAPSPLGIISRCPAFAGLDEDARVQIASDATLHVVRRGQAVVMENTDWPFVGVAFEGVLALTSGNEKARPRIFHHVFPYELFGETELFDEAPAAGRVVALSKTARVLRIPRRSIVEAATGRPELLLAIGRVASQRARDLQQMLATQATLPIVARIAQVLLPFAMPERGLSQALPPLTNMTQAQIAAAAGTVKEVAARAIADLEGRGLLKRERGHIRYLDRQKLLDLIREAG